MNFYLIEPQIPGGFGPQTRIRDLPGGRRELEFAHILLDEVPDDLIKNVFCFAVSDQLMAKIRDAGIADVKFRNCLVEPNEQFRFLSEDMDTSLPQYFEILVEGRPYESDIAREGFKLIVSERFKVILGEFLIPHSKIEPA
jgi:hypothetical protein